MNILIFEDRPSLSAYLQDFFEEAKHSVTICNTCGAVYKEFNNNNRFDCYILDLNAPISGLPKNLHDKTEKCIIV